MKLVIFRPVESRYVVNSAFRVSMISKQCPVPTNTAQPFRKRRSSNRSLGIKERAMHMIFILMSLACNTELGTLPILEKETPPPSTSREVLDFEVG